MIKNRLGITEGVLIAALPVIGYWLAYLYQLGYCTYFNIPTVFIEISILNIMIALVGFASIIASINFYGEPIYQFIRIFLPHPLNKIFVKILLIVSFILAYSVVKNISTESIYFLLLFFALPYLLVDLILPLFSQKNVKGYLEKLKAQDEVDRNEQGDSLMSKIALGLGRNLFLYIAIFGFISFLVYFAGGYKAKTKSNFIVLNEPFNKVVLKNYRNSFVVADYDSCGQKIYPKFKLVPIDSNLEKITVKKIGSLNPVKPE